MPDWWVRMQSAGQLRGGVVCDVVEATLGVLRVKVCCMRVTTPGLCVVCGTAVTFVRTNEPSKYRKRQVKQEKKR